MPSSSIHLPEPTLATQAAPSVTPDPHVDTSRRILQAIFSRYPHRDFTVQFWNGVRWTPDTGDPSRFTLHLRHPGALRQMFAHRSERTLGEAFVHGDFDVEGDLEAAFRAVDYLMLVRPSLLEQVHLLQLVRHLPPASGKHGEFQPATLAGRVHSKARDRRAVTFHYDFSNEFFALWLDRAMVYSCAYFASPSEDVDTAQARKLDYLCRKLRLKPGERLLDIGCGWGGLIVHAARHYGVDATGITLSEPQAHLANARIRQAGLGDRCRAVIRDYRDLGADTPFDKIVSVGMIEHVGEACLPEFCSQAFRVLRPGGAFLLHGIGTSRPAMSRRGAFGEQYVFPDTELVSVATTIAAAEGAGFEVRDVESLREHYALTLRQWIRRLESRWTEACDMVGESACRVWRLFMAGAAYRFAVSDYNLYQTLLVRPDNGVSGVPLTRGDWYVK
ncbi:MAG TPA: cyclopropane-fatty-acyl-phospholipid synthase family protein [Vicinamibacterales bacterium]|jgi:cyclopropane-fatty-acyl-phospholipid synthase